jgi:hypothetical protein
MTNPWQDYWKEMEQLKTNKNMKWSEEGLVTCDFSVGCTLIVTFFFHWDKFCKFSGREKVPVDKT